MARTSKKHEKDIYLSPREQQIMEIIYRHDRGVTATEVMDGLPDDLSNSAVRTFLRILEHKGHLKHDEKDGRYIYKPTRPRATAARAALRKVLGTFFDNSVEKVMATLLTESEGKISEEELSRLQALIEDTQNKGN
jgi:BlaI family transcriptional regulator, penicillinase repressor